MLAAVAASESNLAPPLVRLVPTVARPAAQQAQLPSSHHQKRCALLPSPFRPSPLHHRTCPFCFTTRLSSFNLHSSSSSSSLLLLPIPSRYSPHLNPREGGPPEQLTACYVDDSLIEIPMPACSRSLVSSVRTCQFR